MRDGLNIFPYTGSKKWYKNDEYHRLNGPAFICNNEYRAWYIDGSYHRLDGPAREWFAGAFAGLTEWYYHGEQIKCKNQKEFDRIIQLRIFWDK